MKTRTKEIGGYLELEHMTGMEYHSGLLRINLGRTALLYALKELQVKILYLPYYLCDSVTSVCEAWEGEVKWYHIREDFTPILTADMQHLPEGSWLYVVNGYGQLTDSDLLKLKDQVDHLMVDHTHSFYQRPLPGIPTLYSCRKYFGLPDGAYLSLGNTLLQQEQASTDADSLPAPEVALQTFPASYYSLPQDSSAGRMSHILGRLEDGASAHYKEMLDNAHSYYDAPILRMSPLTENLLRGIDYEAAKKQREANYRKLQELLGSYNPRSYAMSEGPFVYPFYCEHAAEIKKALAAEKIFVPTYWNNVIEEMPKDSVEWDLASHILPLPIDQRYTTEDMAELAAVFLSLLGKIR